MKRWSVSRGHNVRVPKVDAFLAAVRELSVVHGLTIAHEDRHGAFIVEPFNPDNIEWLMHAHDGTGGGRK